IYLNFKKNNDSENQNLLLIFPQEKFEENKEIILNILFFLKAQNNKPNIKVLFSYGDNSSIKTGDQLLGSNIFLDSLEHPEIYTTLIIDFTDSNNSIISYGGGKTSPSYLIKNLYNSILDSKLNFNLPFYYLSQIYTIKFSIDKVLDYYLQQNIPAIKIILNTKDENIDQSEISDFLIKTIINTEINNSGNFDQHFLLFRFIKSQYKIMSEYSIVIIVILIIFSFLLFLFIYFFIIHRKYNPEWKSFKKNIYIYPAILAITFISLLLGRVIGKAISNGQSDLLRFYTTICSQLILSLIFSFSFFTIEINYSKNISENSLDFIVIISTFLNQFIFLMVDISFFPIFMLICITAILSLFIKNRYIKLVLILFMISPLFIYIDSLLSVILNLSNYYDFIFNRISFLFLVLTVCPLYIFLLRIIITFKKDFSNKIKTFLFNSLICFAISLFTIVFSVITYYQLKKKQINNPVIITQVEEASQIFIKYEDSNIIENKIRNLEITIPDDCIKCQVILSNKEGNPILYSDNTFEQTSLNSAYFVIPDLAPEKLYFTYGHNDYDSQIKVICYLRKSENDFYKIEKIFNITKK
ncbi:MAG: hypothetical protein K5866_11520, partial [Treponema sp.]|nr:hypothetical protein [Treponema sp.]